MKFNKLRKQVALVLMVFAIANHIWYLHDHSRVNPDEAFILGQTVSLLDGTGLTYQSSQPNDVSKIRDVYDSRFPPGVAFIFALLMPLFRTPGSVDLFLEIGATIIFFICSFWVFRKLDGQINLLGELYVWLLWVFFPVPLMAANLTAHTSDTFALALYILSVVLGSLLASSNNQIRILFLGALIGALGGLAASLRYLYWPMLAIIPMSLIIFGLVKRKISVFAGAIAIIIGINALFLIGMMRLNLESTGYWVGYRANLYGKAVPRLPYSQAVHWEHLEGIIPFPLFVFGVSDSSFSISHLPLIEQPLSMPASLSVFAWALSGFILVVYLFYIWKVIFTPWYFTVAGKANLIINRNNQYIEFIALAGLLTIGLVSATLAYLSITMEIHDFQGGWVPLMELRYYSATFIFFSIGIAYIISQHENRNQYIRNFSYLISIIAVIILGFVGIWRLQVGHNQLFHTENYITGAEIFRDEIQLYSTLEKYIIPEMPVVVIYPAKDTVIRYRVLSKGFVLCPLVSIPPTRGLSTSAPVNALVVHQYSEPEQTKAYFEDLVAKYQGVCEEKDDYRGCHFLLIP